MNDQSDQDRDETNWPFEPSAAFDLQLHDRRVEIFTLCEGALDQDGRLSLVGTYDAMRTPFFPMTVPKMTVAMRLRFWPGEADLHRVRLVVVSLDGATLSTPYEAELALHPSDKERSSAHHLIAHVEGAHFEAAGEYALDFYLDGQFTGRLPLFIEAIMTFT